MTTPDTIARLESIHAMMASGHRSVRLERHTLLLWGISVAGLIVGVNATFTPDRFPNVALRSLYSNLLIALTLIVIAIVDFYWTRRTRRARDETLSFVQRQLMKVWWLLVALAVVLNVGMNFFGGGYLIYAAVLALMGLALYVQGLFSEQMLEFIGVVLIVLALGAIALGVAYKLMEWLTVAVFGVGFPLLAAASPYSEPEASRSRQFGFASAWLTVVLTCAGIIYHFDSRFNAVGIPTVDAARFQPSPHAQIVHLDAGSVIPVHVHVSGDVISRSDAGTVSLTLAKPLDIVVMGDKPTGHFRFADGRWRSTAYSFRIRNVSIGSRMKPRRGAEAEVEVFVSSDN